MNITINFCYISISLGTEVRFKLTILFFCTKFAQKGTFCRKRKSEHHQWCLHIRINLRTKYQFRLILLIFLDQICQKVIFLVKNRKSKEQHWILHIRISLSKKFQLKLTILIFWTRLQTGKWISALSSQYSN